MSAPDSQPIPTRPVYTPPRPNPGPLWEPASIGFWIGSFLLLGTIAWLILAAWTVFGSGRRSRRVRKPTAGLVEPLLSPADQAVARVKAALEARLGLTTSTLTTVEIKALESLRKLDPAHRTEVLQFLERADRARFSTFPRQVDDWSDQAERIIQDLRTVDLQDARPGARVGS